MAYYKKTSRSLDELEKRLQAYVPDPKYPHDRFSIIAIEEAIAAAREGNFGGRGSSKPCQRYG